MCHPAEVPSILPVAAKLAPLKRESGLTVSVCLPALNEAETIGHLVAHLTRGCLRKLGIIDQVLVMDSGSTDRTAHIAETLGADVHCAADYMPGPEFGMGKGQALWAAVYASSGDIIVFLDSDMTNDPEPFVAGLIGPILKYDADFVKGECRNSPEGPLTTLLAKPALEWIFEDEPHLGTTYFEPLSGEIAARRSILEVLDFALGYAVDVDLAIQLLKRGNDAPTYITDFRQRCHRHRDWREKGGAARSVLHTILRHQTGSGHSRHHSNPLLLPPLITVRGYVKLHPASLPVPAGAP